jgi:hypothetical protein
MSVPNEISIFTDRFSRRYSISCENCSTITEHICDDPLEHQHITLGSYYSVDRDSEDRVFLLFCDYCGIVDITPFKEDVWKSHALHEELHDFIEGIRPDGIKNVSFPDRFLYETEFSESLTGDNEEHDFARWNRCASWLKMVVPKDELEG